jgi:uncharacterized protein YceK
MTRSSVRLFVLTTVALILSGCATIKGPARPKIYDPNTLAANLEKDFSNVNSGQSASTNIPGKADRDRITYELKQVIDVNYERYAQGFEKTQDSAAFAGEVSSGTLSAIVPLVGDAALKGILGVASSLSTATLTSAQKNFYQQQGFYAVRVVMDSEREKKWAEIHTNLIQQEVSTYPLQAAVADMWTYLQAGTAMHAYAAMQQNAAAGAVKAKQEDKTAVQKKLGLVETQ